MRQVLYAFLIVIVFASCGSEDNKPKATIDQETFTQLLVDVRLVEGMYSIHYRNIDQEEGQLADYFKVVFVKYGVTRQQFEDSYRAYSDDGDKIVLIEKEVGERLSKMQAENQEQILNNH